MPGEESKTLQEQSTRNQYLAALVVTLLSAVFGVLEGWTSPSIFLLTSDKTPLPSGEIDMEQASWVVSLLAVGSLIGNICFGYVTYNFGRKLLLMINAISMIISWLLIWFAQNVYYIYAARLLGGFFGGCAYTIVPLFLSEIANDRIRGTLVSISIFTETIGIVTAYIIGNYFDFYAIPKFAIVLTITFIITFYFFPESPLFLIKQNKKDKAEKSIRFYKNLSRCDKGHKLLELEIRKLESTINDIQTEISNKSSFNWSNVTTGITRKAIAIGLVIVILNVFSGETMTNYAAHIFEETGSNLSPNMSTIFVGVIQLLGAFTTTQLIDRSGRKFLIVVSSIGSALGLIVLGSYVMLKSNGFDVSAINWIPVASFSWTVSISELGIQSLTLIVISEIMPEQNKDACVSFCMTVLWTLVFINLKFLPVLIERIGLHVSMFIFAGLCLCCSIFIILFMPETKGKSHEEIMMSLQ